MYRSFSIVWLLLIAGVTLSGQVDTIEGLVAYYPFSGNANDESGNENHGEVDGPVLTTDRFGVEGEAYKFNGVDDIIRVLDDPSLRLEGDFTLSAWVQADSVKDHTIFRKNSGQNVFPAKLAYGLGLSGTSHFTFSVATNEESSGLSSQLTLLPLPYELNVWYRMIAQKEGTRIRLTINMEDDGSFRFYQREVEGEMQYDTAPLLIGSRTRQEANSFKGKIDDIHIYNRFVSLEELTGISFEDMITSTDDIEKSVVKIHPNPFSDQILLERVDYSNGDEINISMFNNLGLKVRSEVYRSGSVRLETSDLSPGIYYLYLEGNLGRDVQRIIKVH